MTDEMICEICGKNPATVHYTAYENSQTKEMHVCQGCAVDKGIVVVTGDKEKFSIADPVVALFGGAGAAELKGARVQCPSCGLLFSGFRQTGRLGCADCYEAFTGQIRPLLRRIHGNQNHVGKSPRREAGALSRRSQLQQMQAELELAIGRENFERAAELRDRIRILRSDAETADPAEGPAS